MALTNEQITAQNFKDFYGQIRPYLNGQVPPVFNKFSKSDLYSTEEKIVGQWIDGKPIYQKIVTASMPSSITEGTAATNAVAHNIANISNIINTYAIGNINETVWGGGTTVYFVSSAADTTNVYLRSNRSSVASKQYNVILQYTKTTDSAVSIGNDTDYSTTEKIIGTWIDGKPLYQKTIEVNNPALNWSPIELDSSTNLNFIKKEVVFIRQSDAFSEFYNSASDFISCMVYSYSGGIVARINQAGNSGILKAIFTIQYTKTTD